MKLNFCYECLLILNYNRLQFLEYLNKNPAGAIKALFGN